jgi:hypothetical protein
MNARRRLVTFCAFAFCAFAFLTTGCVETTNGAAHVRAGQLFVPGEKIYDDYFEAVHTEQTKEAHWAADRKTAHQPIVTALKLDDDATDSAISQAVHAKPGAVQAWPIEQTVHADQDRVKAMNAVAAKAEELVKKGHDLEGHVSENFGKPGSGLGPTPEDVKRALVAAFEVLANIREHAKKEAKAAEELAENLRSEPAGGHAEHAREPGRQASSPMSSTPRTTPQQPSAAQPTPQQPPQPPQPPPHPTEVFQP